MPPKTPQLQELEKLDKEITSLINSGIKGKKAWRKACNLAIQHNPTIRMEAVETMKWCKEERLNLKDTKFANSDDKSKQHVLKFPASLFAILKAVDPENMMTNHDNQIMRDLWKAFPEFRIAEKV